MDFTVIKKWWLASTEVKITMAVAFIIWIDPVSWAATHPELVAMLPDGVEVIFLKVLGYISMAALFYQRVFVTKTALTFNKTEVTPPAIAAIATGKLTSVEIDKMRETLAAIDAAK